MSNYNNEIKLLPLIKGRTAELRVQMDDKPGNLTPVTQLLAKLNVGIVISQMKVIERGHLAEWHSIVDLSECENPKRLNVDLAKMKVVKRTDLKMM